MSALFVTVIIRGVPRYIKLTSEEQEDGDFEPKFPDIIIAKGKKHDRNFILIHVSIICCYFST